MAFCYPQALLARKSGSLYATAAGKLPFHPQVLTEGVRFLQECLATSAGVKSEHRSLGTSLPMLAAYLGEIATSSEHRKEMR